MGAPMKVIKAVLPYDIDSIVVPDDLAGAFMSIATKPQNFYAGYDRSFVCRGRFFAVHTSYDDELRSAGILESA